MTTKKKPGPEKTLEPLSYRRLQLPDVIGFPLRTVDKYLADGSLRSYRRGRCRFVLRDDLKAFLSGSAS